MLKWSIARGYPPYDTAVGLAAEAGHLSVLQWMKEHNISITTNASAPAARNGHLHILIWLKSISPSFISDATAPAAAERNNIEMLKWLRESALLVSGMQINAAAASAAASGHIEALEYLRGLPTRFNGFDVTAAAARNGHLAVLRWLRTHRYPWNSQV